jgi:hypothetical protein
MASLRRLNMSILSKESSNKVQSLLLQFFSASTLHDNRACNAAQADWAKQSVSSYRWYLFYSYQHNTNPSRQSLLSRTTCFGTCVPFSGLVFNYNYSIVLSLNFPCKPIGSTGALYAIYSTHYITNYNEWFLAYFPKVGLCDFHSVGVSVYPPINFWMPEPTFMKLGGNWAHLNGVLHKSLTLFYVSVCVSPIVARKWIGKVYPSFHC